MCKQRAVKTYGILGKTLCGIAGAIVGFIVGGPFMAIPGVVTGVLSGHLLEKSIINATL